MATVRHSIVLREKPQRVWDLVSNFNNWGYLTRPDSLLNSKKAEFQSLGGTGQGMRFQISTNGKSGQTWQIHEWVPPRRLSAFTAASGGGLYAVSSWFSCDIAPVDSLDTRLDMRFEIGFSHPVVGAFLNWFIRENSLKHFLEHFADRLQKLLARE